MSKSPKHFCIIKTSFYDTDELLLRNSSGTKKKIEKEREVRI